MNAVCLIVRDTLNRLDLFVQLGAEIIEEFNVLLNAVKADWWRCRNPISAIEEIQR